MNYRSLILFIIIICSQFGYCQVLMDWPYLNESRYYKFSNKSHFSSLPQIINKAKLLTLLKIGFDETDSIIANLSRQSYTYYYPDTSYKYMTIAIVNSQPFRIKDRELDKYNNSMCKFTLVYSFLENRFYLIQGFENNNIKDFSKSLQLSEYADFNFFFLNQNDYVYHWEHSLIDFNEYIDYLNSDSDSTTLGMCCKCIDTYDTLFSTNPVYGTDDSIQRLQILNKAKLLTLSVFGIMPTDSIIRSLLDQKAEIKSYNNKGYYEIIEIYNQKFGFTYRLIYCYNTGKYYKIEGFQHNDYLEFLHLTKKLGDDILPFLADPNPSDRKNEEMEDR